MAYKRKGKKAAEIVPMSAEDIRLIEEHVDDLVKSQLPLGRVKKIVRLDPDVEMVNSEAVRLMTKAAELFIRELGKSANTNAILERRKTVQLKDIDKSIKKCWTFAFLEDALDGWPKIAPRKRKVNDENTIPEESSAECVEDEILDESQVEIDNDIEDDVIDETPESSQNVEETVVDQIAEQF